MKSGPKISCPILFMTFNRFKLTKKVFKEIKKAKPAQLFISSDGSRKDIPKEKKEVEKIRNWILKNIDWKCKVKTLFRKKNLGCEKSCYGAITWFFENVEQGIILEDDCLPDQSFFRFCQELLEKYKDNERITSISGMAALPKFCMHTSYKFIKYNGLWGWASWRRAWKKIYDSELKIIDKTDPKIYLKKVFVNPLENLFFSKRFLDYRKKVVNTWEFPWVLGQIRRKGLSILPRTNMILNIGMTQGFTNTKPNKIDQWFMTFSKKETKFPLIHPSKIKVNLGLGYLLLFRDVIRILTKKIINLG